MNSKNDNNNKLDADKDMFEKLRNHDKNKKILTESYADYILSVAKEFDDGFHLSSFDADYRYVLITLRLGCTVKYEFLYRLDRKTFRFTKIDDEAIYAYAAVECTLTEKNIKYAIDFLVQTDNHYSN